MAKTINNLQGRIFAHIREAGLTYADKCALVQAGFGKRHVAHLTRPQGLLLEEYLQEVVSGAIDHDPELLKTRAEYRKV